MHKDKKEKRRTKKADEILQAAARMISAEGIEGFSMRKLAAKMEVSATALYFYFKDKESLLRALCDQGYKKLAEAQRPPANASGRERLRNHAHVYLRFAMEEPELYQLLFIKPIALSLGSESTVAKGSQEDSYALFMAALDETLQTLPVTSDARLSREELAHLVWSLAHGVAGLALAFSNDPWFELGGPTERFDRFLDFVLDGLSSTR